MKREGYFVITHDMDSVEIYFLEKSLESEQLFKDLNSTDAFDYEAIMELWYNYNDIYKYEAWGGDKWKFNDCYILDVCVVYGF